MIILSYVLYLCVVNTIGHDIKGFDDSIYFSINWPGDTVVEDSDSDSLEHLIVTTVHQEKYKCSLPDVREQEADYIDKYDGPAPLELISPLFTQSSCSYRLESYWTYEVCHGRYIRQYHEDREGKKVKLQEYTLGQWDKKHQETVMQDKAFQNDNKNALELTKRIDGANLPYLELTMGNGTSCDLNQNKPRQTKVIYVCFVHGKHEIFSLKETSTCQYEIIILSPLLCAHPRYKPQKTGDNQINCVPLDGSPNKPHNLLKMKAESSKLRRRSDIDSIRVEFVPMDFKEGKPIPETPPIDTSPVQAFLTGRNCLHGGTGWWKYEFCYGKSVEQYHVEKDRSKIAINLGNFDREKHLEWIARHPNKRPKPIAIRTQLSHFYSDGSVCDKTGKPRQTEVKLKCLENASNLNAVSLYLLEPRYCEYILGVESPLICDILIHADENGLVEPYGARDDGIPTVNINNV